MKMQTDRTMDRRTEGWTEEWKDRRMEGERRTEGQTDLIL